MASVDEVSSNGYMKSRVMSALDHLRDCRMSGARTLVRWSRFLHTDQTHIYDPAQGIPFAVNDTQHVISPQGRYRPKCHVGRDVISGAYFSLMNRTHTLKYKCTFIHQHATCHTRTCCTHIYTHCYAETYIRWYVCGNCETPDLWVVLWYSQKCLTVFLTIRNIGPAQSLPQIMYRWISQRYEQHYLVILMDHYMLNPLNSDTIDIDGLMQGRRNSIANALGLRLSCTNPST